MTPIATTTIGALGLSWLPRHTASAYSHLEYIKGWKLFCNKCGSKYPGDASFCHKCGAAVWDVTSPGPELAAAAPALEVEGASSTPLAGVKGWLLFFCISLTLLTPLVSLGARYQEWVSSSPYFAAFPGLRSALLIDSIAGTFFAAFSIYAGYLLWSITPGAVAIAKAFLLTLLAYAFLATFGLHAMVNSPPGTGFGVEQLKSIVHSVIFFAIWFTYLHKSKRVRATYGVSSFEDWSAHTMIEATEIAWGLWALLLVGAVVFSNLRY